jgi:hypothetical protein
MHRLRRRCSEKTSDAQPAQACCDLGDPREGLLAAAGLWARRRALEDLSLCVQEDWQVKTAGQAVRAGFTTPAVWLSSSLACAEAANHPGGLNWTPVQVSQT